MSKLSIYEDKGPEVKPFDLVVANTSEHDLTENKVYVVHENNWGGLITIVNNLGKKELYTTEYFYRYNGERVDFPFGGDLD